VRQGRRHAAPPDGSSSEIDSAPPLAGDAAEDCDELPERLCFELDESAAGERLDVVLARLTDMPRAQIRRWIENGRVTVDARLGKPGQRLAEGAVIEARRPQPEMASIAPEAIDLDVVYEDDDLVVVNKAAQMVVHPAPGHSSGTLVNALLHRCGDLAGVGGVLRPGIVHRLDKGTTGILVVAKNDRAHIGLARQFEDHSVERVYLAFVRGTPGRDSGRIDRPIGRHRRDRKRMSIRTESGREAVTAWEVIRRFPASDRSQLEVRPQTGRTHQIRVHLGCAGMPIVGDAVYGRTRGRGPAGLELDRPALHAAVLGFVHPIRRDRMRFEAPLPDDLACLLAALEARERAG
jgi:23S rRNA pseudouridine1911/1915/1917 synthase